MTIREFADYCGVSQATASRFFSGEGSLSSSISERLRAAAEETGYHPSPARQRRRKETRSVICVVVPRWRQHYFVDALTALQEEIIRAGRQMVVLPGEGDGAEKTFALLRTIAPEGVVLLGDEEGDSLPDLLYHRGIPAVLCGEVSPSRRFPAVHIDDIAAAYDGTNYLLGLGHRRIAVLSDRPHAISSGFQRVTGCRKALEDAGLTLPEESVRYAGSSFEDGCRGMASLLDGGVPFTAVFAFSDDMAAGAAALLADRGVRVPGDVSLLGFDDSSTAAVVRPALTTVHQPIAQIAQRSLEALLSPSHTPESVTLPHAIIERESCAAPPQ